jgi:hypothetical protein
LTNFFEYSLGVDIAAPILGSFSMTSLQRDSFLKAYTLGGVSLGLRSVALKQVVGDIKAAV